MRKASEPDGKAKAVYAELQPKDIVNKYEWLFRQGWVEESADELAGDEMDFERVSNA